MVRTDSVHFIENVFPNEAKDVAYKENEIKQSHQVLVKSVPVSDAGSQSDGSGDVDDGEANCEVDVLIVEVDEKNEGVRESNAEDGIVAEEKSLESTVAEGNSEHCMSAEEKTHESSPEASTIPENNPHESTAQKTRSQASTTPEDKPQESTAAEPNSETLTIPENNPHDSTEKNPNPQVPIMAEDKPHQLPTTESISQPPITSPSNPHHTKATQILHLISTYSTHSTSLTPEATSKFLPLLTTFVTNNTPILILLPAFPFKSPNTKTVTLGTLPDFGEELALARMNSLGDAIKRVYAPGARIEICSDGLVYGDVVGVPEETLWSYGQELRAMALRLHFANLVFVRLWDILSHPGASIQDPEAAKTYYLTHATCLRRELEYRYSDPNFSPDEAIQNDKDWQLTYKSYIDYLTREFENAADAEAVAKRMLIRGKAYVTALAANRAHYIRLSIHDSLGKAKLSVSLIPHQPGTVGYMPWRSAVAVDEGGTYRTVFPGEVRDTHDVVCKYGRPYLLRFKSELWDWKNEGLDVEFEFLYPRGVVVRPSPESGHASSLLPLIPMEKVRQLSKSFSPVVLRGFSGEPNEAMYVVRPEDLGRGVA